MGASRLRARNVVMIVIAALVIFGVGYSLGAAQTANFCIKASIALLDRSGITIDTHDITKASELFWKLAQQ